MAGRKVYAAGVIAAYTFLANIAVGCVLYGLNLQARGSRGLGRFLVGLGIAGMIALMWAMWMGATPSRLVIFIGPFTAFCFYQFEKGPVKAALREGAELARWWPPALWLMMAVGALLGIRYLVP